MAQKRDQKQNTGPSPFEAFLAARKQEFPALGDLRRTFRERPPSFRVNTLKSSVDRITDTCQRNGIKLKRANWSKHAFLMPTAVQREIEKLDIYENGEVYLQSLASQVPPLVLDAQPGERILDLCAAPGGKTAQIAAMMKGEGHLVAVEKEQIRYERLKFNLQKQGVLEERATFSVSLIHGDALNCAIDGLFDRILIDAPCSGEARFIESKRDTWRHWNPEFVSELAVLQKALIRRAVSLLKPGGTLVYSTCTLGSAENELVVAEAIALGMTPSAWPSSLSNGPQLIPAALKYQGKQSIIGYRLKPTDEIEGFFISRLDKKRN